MLNQMRILQTPNKYKFKKLDNSKHNFLKYNSWLYRDKYNLGKINFKRILISFLNHTY